MAVKCDQEPATLSFQEAVKKTCCAYTEDVAGSHALHGAAEVAVKLVRQQVWRNKSNRAVSQTLMVSIDFTGIVSQSLVGYSLEWNGC